MWNVSKYFDDHFDGVVSVHETKEEAEKARDALKAGVYVSYKVRQQ